MAQQIRVRNDRVEYCTARLCGFLGVSQKTLSNWEKDGCPKSSRGWWDLESVLKWRGLVGDCGLRSVDKLDALSMHERKLAAEVVWKEEQSELVRLRKMILNGDFLRRSDVVDDYKRFFIVLKRFLLSIPHFTSGSIAASVEPAIARRIEKDLTIQIKKKLTQFVLSAGIDGDG